MWKEVKKMFENIMNLFKKLNKKEKKVSNNSKDAAKERLHLVLMQDRANVSADFLELMKQEIIDVIKKYIDIDESAIDVRLTNKENEDGTNGAPALYANIPIINIKNDTRKLQKNNVDDNNSSNKQKINKADNEENLEEKKKEEKEEKEKKEDKAVAKKEKDKKDKEDKAKEEKVIEESQSDKKNNDKENNNEKTNVTEDEIKSGN